MSARSSKSKKSSSSTQLSTTKPSTNTKASSAANTLKPPSKSKPPPTPTTPLPETLSPSDSFNSSFFVSITKTICFSYLLLALFLYFMQGKLIFVGSLMGGSDAVIPAEFVNTKFLSLQRDNGALFRVAVHTNPEARGVALFFGGNGETMPALIFRCEQFARYGLTVVAVEYPGYGNSTGPPTISTIYEAAEHAAVFADKIAKDHKLPLFIIGSSIGSFPAVHLTALGYGKATLLHAPLTALVDVAARLYWYMPVRSLLDKEYRFDNVENFQKIRETFENEGEKPRVLILHGDRDEIIPHHVGRECASLLGNAAVFQTVQGGSHNDIPMHYDGPLGERLYEFFNTP